MEAAVTHAQKAGAWLAIALVGAVIAIAMIIKPGDQVPFAMLGGAFFGGGLVQAWFNYEDAR